MGNAYRLFFLSFLLVFNTSIEAQNWNHSPSENRGFVENRNQFNHFKSQTNQLPRYIYDGNNEDYLVYSNGFSIRMREIQFDEIAEFRNEELKEHRKKDFSKPGEWLEEERKEHSERDSKVIRDLVEYEWIGSNPNAETVLEDVNSFHHSYWFKDANGHHVNQNNISSGRKVRCKNLYPGIDVIYEFHPQGGLKYSLEIQPGADISLARLKSSKKTKLNDEGQLISKTKFGLLTEHAPVCFYKDAPSVLLNSSFLLHSGYSSFFVNNTNPTQVLEIDPWIQTPSFNTNWDCVWECDRDAAGNVYIIGGVMPMQLLKYNSAGSLQWTYNTPYDTTNWLGAMATDLNGNTYITQGTDVAIQKVNTSGTVAWNNPNPGALFSLTEFWTISFNCDQTKLMVGGTGGSFQPIPYLYEIDLNSGNVLNDLQVSSSPPLGGINAGNEVRAITSSKNGRYYYLTHDTIGSVNQNLNACGGEGFSNQKTATGYVLGYKCENFRYSNSGVQAIKTYGDFVFVNRGDILEKRDLITGDFVSSVIIPGGSFIVTTVPFFGTTTALGNSGLDIDDCGNIYAGSTNGVYRFDQNLSILNNYPTTFKVYDVAVSTAGDLIACGTTGDQDQNNRSGGVQSFAVSACAPQVPVCCNTSICEVPNLCTNDSPIQLVVGSLGGTWSGTGVSATGLFNPASAGVGTFSITYQLPCGSEIVTLIVNSCTALNVCEESNGTYSVEGGTAPYSWSYYTPAANIPITNQAECVACGYTWFFGNCLNGFFPAESCDTPASWNEYATGVNATAPSIFPARVTDNAGTEFTINAANQVLPCEECSSDSSSISLLTCDNFTNPLGTIFTQSGIYSYTLLNSAGCDSTIVLDLTIQTDTSTTTNLTICNAQLPFNWNGLTFNGPGTQSLTLISLAGCDSLAALNLSVLDQLISTTNVTACVAQLPYLWNGVTFNGAGSQSVTLTSIAGCDSIATLNLNVVNQLTSTSNLAICDVQLPFIWNGIMFNAAGSQSSTLTNSAGCDSIATLNLSVNSFVPNTDIQSACSSFTWIDGNTYSSSTNSPTFTISGGSAAGCDSVITLNLTVNQNTSSQQNINACGPYQNDLGQIFNESGSYNFVLPTSAGCDSVVTVNVTILPLPNVTVIPSDATIFKGESLQLLASGAVNYAWYPTDSLSCDTCPSPIANPTETITYVVMGTDAFGCTTLDTIRIEVDIRCNEPFIPTIFSPNGKGPVANELLCLFSNCVDKLKFVVYNRWGEQVFETEDITKCWDGFYKDELAMSGTYVYNLYILQLDGTVVNKKGTISLVK